MDDYQLQLKNIESRLDKIDENLDRHMKRSDALEEQMKPMKELMTDMRAFYRILKVLAVIATIIEGFRLTR